MFWTIIIFPTALLQANLLIALHIEKKDMWLNIASLALNFAIAFFGLTIFNDISFVNYAIFISFLLFHISQDVILIKSGIHNRSDAFLFYVLSALVLLAYHFLSIYFSSLYFFLFFWLFFAFVSLVYVRTMHRERVITV